MSHSSDLSATSNATSAPMGPKKKSAHLSPRLLPEMSALETQN